MRCASGFDELFQGIRAHAVDADDEGTLRAEGAACAGAGSGGRDGSASSRKNDGEEGSW